MYRIYLNLIAIVFQLVVLIVLVGQATGQTPGNLDLSFGNGGKVITPFDNSTSDFAYAAAIQPDGKIVSAGGISDFLLARHNPDGSLDKTFGTGGKVVTPIGSFTDRGFALAIQADGKIVAAGATLSNFHDFAIVRYNTDGTLDGTFGNGGKVTTAIGTSDDFAYSIAIQADGKIIAAGFTYNMNEDFALVRYNSDGTLDNTFGVGGKVITQFGSGGDSITAIAIQLDGKIVAVGWSSGFALVRYNTDGTLDNSFGTNGKVTTAIGDSSSAFAIAIQPDGKIIAAGAGGNQNSDFALARYHANGTLDSSFGMNGTVITPITGLSRESAEEVLLQENGKIVAVGYSYMHGSTTDDFALARYNADGSLDSSFGNGGKVVTPIRSSYDAAFSAVLQTDGKIVAVGYSDTDGPGIDVDFALIRYIGDPVVSRRTSFDFDGDGRADISVFRPDSGIWYLLNSTSGFSSIGFGVVTDKIVPADYDGDGKTDVAVYRDGLWYIERSGLGFTGVSFGVPSDIPVPADYDADGKADIAVFRPSNGVWYLLQSTSGFTGFQFGQIGDKPVAADYDGDGKADFAVYRNGIWYIQRSQLGFTGVSFGIATDKPVPADYDGDGKADIAVFRIESGVWYLQKSRDGFAGITFGLGTDKPIPADYDGDGKTDVAVFRDGNWFLLYSRNNQFAAVQFGINTDKPVPAVNISQ